MESFPVCEPLRPAFPIQHNAHGCVFLQVPQLLDPFIVLPWTMWQDLLNPYSYKTSSWLKGERVTCDPVSTKRSRVARAGRPRACGWVRASICLPLPTDSALSNACPQAADFTIFKRQASKSTVIVLVSTRGVFLSQSISQGQRAVTSLNPPWCKPSRVSASRDGLIRGGLQIEAPVQSANSAVVSHRVAISTGTRQMSILLLSVNGK